MIVDAVAVRFQLLPDVIDMSYWPTFSGVGGLLAMVVGAGLRFDTDRLARLVLFGNVAGGALGMLILALAALGVLS